MNATKNAWTPAARAAFGIVLSATSFPAGMAAQETEPLAAVGDDTALPLKGPVAVDVRPDQNGTFTFA